MSTPLGDGLLLGLLFISLEVLGQGASVFFLVIRGTGSLESESVAHCDCRNATHHSNAGDILWTVFSKQIKWARMEREKLWHKLQQYSRLCRRIHYVSGMLLFGVLELGWNNSFKSCSLIRFCNEWLKLINLNNLLTYMHRYTQITHAHALLKWSFEWCRLLHQGKIASKRWRTSNAWHVKCSF